MKHLLLLLFIFSTYSTVFSQAEKYNLASKNLHKKVRKTIDYYGKKGDKKEIKNWSETIDLSVISNTKLAIGSSIKAVHMYGNGKKM